MGTHSKEALEPSVEISAAFHRPTLIPATLDTGHCKAMQSSAESCWRLASLYPLSR